MNVAIDQSWGDPLAGYVNNLGIIGYFALFGSAYARDSVAIQNHNTVD